MQHDGSRYFAIFRAAYFLFYRGKLFFIGMSSQDIAAVLREAGDNLSRLRWSFTLSENNFWHARTQGTVMVNFCETKIFER